MASVSTNIRIDADVKKAAQELFNDLGMDMTTAVNIFLHQAVREQRIPFIIGSGRLNTETINAIKAAEDEKNLSPRFKNIDDLIDDLNA